MKTAAIFMVIVLLGLSVALPSNQAYACSPSVDVKYPTFEDTLEDNGALFIGKILGNGSHVVAQVLEIREGEAPEYIALISPGHSCANMFDFQKDMYIVVVTPENENFIIDHSDLDRQFSYFYPTLDEARAAAEALEDGNRPQSPTPLPKVTVSYTPAGYTLRPGAQGGDVLMLQTALLSLPYILLSSTMEKNAIYDQATMKTVESFQRFQNLTVDGIAGPLTQSKLTEVGIIE